jgi:hypothetical protein
MGSFYSRFECSYSDSLRIHRGFSYNSQVLKPTQFPAEALQAEPAMENPGMNFGRGEWE